MKTIINNKHLLKLVVRTQQIVEKKTSMPVLMNILLEAKKGKLAVYATNLEVSLTDSANCEVLDEGKIVIPAKSLFEIVKELKDGDVTLERQSNNWLRISQDRSLFNIVGLNPLEYPVFQKYSLDNSFKVDVDILSDMIEKTIYSVSTDETRYHLNGVLFEEEADTTGVSFKMVATDGHRLSMIKRRQSIRPDLSLNKKVIIPRKGLVEIKKLLDDAEGSCEMALEGAQLVVKYKSVVLLVRLIEGRYPNYTQLIPQKNKNTLVLDRGALLGSLKRVSLLSHQKSKSIIFSLKSGGLKISSNNPDLGDAKEELIVDYSGDNVDISFNAKYIIEALNAMTSEQIEFKLDDGSVPGIIMPANDSHYTCVVMPIIM